VMAADVKDLVPVRIVHPARIDPVPGKSEIAFAARRKASAESKAEPTEHDSVPQDEKACTLPDTC
jgi:hypothetical protein